VSLAAAIADIVAGMRAEGLSVGPGEAIDAGRAAALLGVADRVLLEAGLASTLAKTPTAREAFARHFARVFAAPAAGGDGRRGRRGAGGAGTVGAPAARGAGGAGAGGRARDVPPEARPTPARCPAPRPGPGPAPRGTERRGRPGERPPAEGPGERQAPAPTARERERQARHARRAAPAQPPGQGDPRRWPLGAPLTLRDEAAVVAELPRLLATLRLATSRRRRAGRRGPLDVQRALRTNQRHGGVPFLLPRRERRPAPPHLAFLLDVSWSAARGAGLLLLLSAAILRRFASTRVWVFVDRPVAATAAVRAWLRGELPAAVLDRLPSPPLVTRHRRPGERPRPGDRPDRGARPGAGLRPPGGGGPDFASLLAGLAGLDPGAPSDYGRALTAFAAEAARWPRNTLLVVYGDGRTNRFPPCPWAVEELCGRLREVVWLAPEPRARWGTGDSALLDYAAAGPAVYSVETAAALSAALHDVVRRLR
jgi:hypothetical protein